MVCTAEILSLAGFSLVPALLPQFMTIWSLNNAQGGWLAGIMSGGYMLAVLPLVVLMDRRGRCFSLRARLARCLALGLLSAIPSSRARHGVRVTGKTGWPNLFAYTASRKRSAADDRQS